MTDSTQPWWHKAFGESYRLVYAHRTDHAAETEVSSVCAWMAMATGATVLDAACGDGRHLARLVGRGLAAVGIDYSAAMCRAARARGLGVARADHRRLPFADGGFAHVVSFFSSIGYFEDAAEDARVVREFRRVLKARGRLMLDLADAAFVRSHLAPSSTTQGRGVVVHAERTLAGNRVRKHVRVVADSGTLVDEYDEDLRLYAADEVDALLASAGFRVVARHGSFSGAAAGGGDRMITIAEACA